MTNSDSISNNKRNPSKSIDEIKREHSDLLESAKAIARDLKVRDRLQCSRELSVTGAKGTVTTSPECAPLKDLLGAVDEFLDELTKLSADPGTVENYLWVCDTAVSWEHRLSDMFNVSKTVSLNPAPTDLLPPLAPGDALSESELDSRIDSLAKVVHAYELRKQRHYENVHGLTEWDRHQAEVFLVVDILNGTVNFARRISSRSYPRLEKVWMAEVRELLAYLNWEASGAQIFDPHTDDHFVKAWRDFRERLLAPEIKARPDEFGEAKRYLEERYVTMADNGYELDYEKINKNRDNNIIEIKSRRIQQMRAPVEPDRRWDDDQNWRDGETYVKMFYENIIPAVMNADAKNTDKVFQAFDFSIRGKFRMVSAFEMALAVYFLRSESVDSFLGKGGPIDKFDPLA